MLRAWWFVLKVGLLIAVAVWVANRPGTIEISWLGYDIRAHVGFFLLFVLISLLLLLICYRFFITMIFKKRERSRIRGLRAVTSGLSAIAAGNAKLAAMEAERSRRLLPKETPLPLLLEARAARLDGDHDKARNLYEKLVKDQDAAFLGLRGLMLDAAESGEPERALIYAKKALRKHSGQPELILMVYDLELRTGDWNAALKSLEKARKVKALDLDKIKSDRVAILLCQADEDLEQGRKDKIFAKLKKAHRIDMGSVPAAVRLAEYYIEQGKRSAAIRVLEKTWKEKPHPDMVKLWGGLVPKKKSADTMVRLRWFEKLTVLNSASSEGMLASAQGAIEGGLWGEARSHLLKAEQIRPSSRLYRIWAKLEEAMGHPEGANNMLEKSADALADKVWTCSKTGRIYESWSPIARPHGSFNTIVWDYPMLELSSDEDKQALLG